MKQKSDQRGIGPSNRVWLSALMVCWDSKTVMGLMCFSVGGWGMEMGRWRRTLWPGRQWDLGFMMGVSENAMPWGRGSIELDRFEVSRALPLGHVFVFTPCSNRISTQWGATVRRIFQHLEVLLSGALCESFSPWTWALVLWFLKRGPFFTFVFQLTTVQSYTGWFVCY